MTLDSSSFTFTLDRTLYADFSHDDDITSILSAMGLFDQTAPLSNTAVQGADKTNGFSASHIVPFSSRVYFEKMVCEQQYSQDTGEELIRVVLNDRVLPLQQCSGDELGRCTVSAFVDSLNFA